MATGNDHTDVFSVGQETRRRQQLCTLPIMDDACDVVVDSFWRMLVWVLTHHYSPMMCDGDVLLISLAGLTLHPLCIGTDVCTTCWALSNALQAVSYTHLRAHET